MQKTISEQQSLFTKELSDFKKSLISSTINTCATAELQSDDSGSTPLFPGNHYNHHSSNFLEQENIVSLKAFVEDNHDNFTKVGDREVLYFGEFNYKYGSTEHTSSPIPNPIQQIIDKIQTTFPDSPMVNSCLITKYINGSIGCPSHGDDEPFIDPTSDIFTYSIGADRVMKFVNANKHTKVLDDSITLKDNDIISFSRASQDFNHHSILTDNDVSESRYSFTFRRLAPYNINYTSIIGDSNTQNLAFGSGMGKLGQWLPGTRHKASQIKDIPDPFTIGPCRNIVLNVGINDIQQNMPKSTDCLVNELDSKIKPIMTVYPKTKIFISLLLPTKNAQLNFNVNKLNTGFKNLAEKYRNVSIIEHHNLVDQFGYLNPLLGRYRRGIPNPDDHIHLGPKGIKNFVRNLKSAVLRKPSSVRGIDARSQPAIPHPPRVTQHPSLTPTAPPWTSLFSNAESSTHAFTPYYPATPAYPFHAPASQSSVSSHQQVDPRYNSQYPTLSPDEYRH